MSLSVNNLFFFSSSPELSEISAYRFINFPAFKLKLRCFKLLNYFKMNPVF